jgi:predicted glutamine amidotransferase
MPSWGDINLKELSSYVRSPTVFAHVRAMDAVADAVVGSVSIQNCHPFRWGTYTFMHNGGIRYFSSIKRRMQAEIDDEFYQNIAGKQPKQSIPTRRAAYFESQFLGVGTTKTTSLTLF